ncbi:ProQ/FinO domain protein [Vibrio phage 1.293.O._10N.261.52.E1]|nr:ProQ/FinO domain protein [Vibrio phage 1.293.O._10N.261.52.E1]
MNFKGFRNYKRNIDTLLREFPMLLGTKDNPNVLSVGVLDDIKGHSSIPEHILKDVMNVWCSRIEYHRAMVEKHSFRWVDYSGVKPVLRIAKTPKSRRVWAWSQLGKRAINNPKVVVKYELYRLDNPLHQVRW